MVTRKPNWSFRDSKARDWLRKGKVLAPLVRPTKGKLLGVNLVWDPSNFENGWSHLLSHV
jgi:hypothetical protein